MVTMVVFMEAILHGSTEDVSIIEKSVEREREGEREREEIIVATIFNK